MALRASGFYVWGLLALVLTVSSLHADKRVDSLYYKAVGLDELRAIPLLLRAHKIAPRDRRVTYRLGFVYQKMSRLTQAEDYYQKTLAIDKCHVKALNNLGGLRLDQRRDGEAKALYLRAVRCRGKYYLPYYNLGGMLLAEGEAARAAALYEQALKRSPKHASSHHNLAIAYEKMSSSAKEPERTRLREKAREHFGRACDLDPKDALNFFNYGRILFNHGMHVEAEPVLRRAVSLSSSDSRLRGRALRMIAHLKKEEPKKAEPKDESKTEVPKTEASKSEPPKSEVP